MTRVVIRADASASIGSGHVMRCLALAEFLAARGADVVFVSRAPKGNLISETERRGHKVLRLPAGDDAWTAEQDASDFVAALDRLAPLAGGERADWVIVDHYGLGEVWERAVRPLASRVMAIDDLADRPHAVDVLLDQNLVGAFETRYDDLVGAGCLKLLGPRYALLAKNYAALRPQVRRPATIPANILVYFGGADTRLTMMTAEALTRLPQPFCATIVVDDGNDQAQAVQSLAKLDGRIRPVRRLPDLASAMLSSDIFVGASGTTSWERLCLGLPAIVITLATNQVPLAQELARRGFINCLGDAGAATADLIAAALASAVSKPTDPRSAQAMMNMVDGAGAERVCDVLLYNAGDDIIMRAAAATDSDLVLAWANDPGTRRYAFSTGPISREVHAGWFARRVDNSDILYLIAETTNGIALGQVRFELQDDGGWEISYLLAPAFRGLGLARKILAAAIKRLTLLHPTPIVTGLVKPENTASLRVFAALGFVGAPAPEHAGAIRFILNREQGADD